MDFQTYKTRKDAQAAADKMQGWSGKQIVQMYLPDDPNANRNGNAWVIRCRFYPTSKAYVFMRTDGYVR